MRETETGLLVELTGETGSERYELPLNDVSALLDWQDAGEVTPNYERARSADEGTLKSFLERHQRVLVDTQPDSFHDASQTSDDDIRRAHRGFRQVAEPDFYVSRQARRQYEPTASAHCDDMRRVYNAGCIVRTNRRGRPAERLALCSHAEVRASALSTGGHPAGSVAFPRLPALPNRSPSHVSSCPAVHTWMPVRHVARVSRI